MLFGNIFLKGEDTNKQKLKNKVKQASSVISEASECLCYKRKYIFKAMCIILHLLICDTKHTSLIILAIFLNYVTLNSIISFIANYQCERVTVANAASCDHNCVQKSYFNYHNLVQNENFNYLNSTGQQTSWMIREGHLVRVTRRRQHWIQRTNIIIKC